MSKGFTVWLTGLSGAGKSTIAQALGGVLQQRGRSVEVVDGDEVRTTLSKGLGFSREDRDTNIARIALVCALLSKHGVVAISAAISPYAQARAAARRRIGEFVEVYVQCPIGVLKARDVKGLYEKAVRGEITNFTGISDPYETPEAPDVVVNTDVESVEESVARIIEHLEERCYILPSPSEEVA